MRQCKLTKSVLFFASLSLYIIGWCYKTRAIHGHHPPVEQIKQNPGQEIGCEEMRSTKYFPKSEKHEREFVSRVCLCSLTR